MWFALLVLILLIPLAAVVLDSQLGRALAARVERRPGREGESLDRRIAFLESEVERLGSELRRLEEESEFLHRLLAQRHISGHVPDGRLPPHEREG